ncbi:MAG: TonB-dependent receptor, partial [Xanthomonadales bacterium]|nr:TonB-dependent receptor [Xanthomonadales bacterium]
MLSAAIWLALYGAPGLALADATPEAAPTPQQDSAADAPEQTLDAVVATYAQSLEKALDTKRESVGQVDSIVAEDIGKFPDLNLAESLQRIPGVAITRDAGEGRNISVRGLGPDFTRVRINGIEALATTGGTDSSGGSNRGRGFDFNVFASDLFNELLVHKTASADIEEGSLGATVDLRTARPFDYDGFTFVSSAQLGYNDLSEETNPRGAMMISNTFGDGSFGALLSVAYTDRTLIEQGHSTVRWDRATSSGGFSASSPFSEALSGDVFHPRIPRYGVLEHDQQRIGITTSLQWEPAAGTLLTLDGMYAKFEAERTENFLEAVSFSRSGQGKPQTVVLDGSIAPNGNLEYGVFDNVDVRSETRFDELDTTFKQFSLELSHEFSDSLSLHALGGFADSRFENPIQTTITLDHPDAVGYSWDYRGSNREPIINYGFDVTNPANWNFAQGLSEIRLRPQATDNELNTFQLDLRWQASDAFALNGGFNWKEYDFRTTERRRSSET